MLFPGLSLRGPGLPAGSVLGVLEKDRRGGGTALARHLGHRGARLAGRHCKTAAGSFGVFLGRFNLQIITG